MQFKEPDKRYLVENHVVMKYLSYLFLLLGLLTVSCNNNDEPPLEFGLPISGTFIPATVEYDETQLTEAQKKNLIHLVNNQHVVNDVSELPEDPFGFSDTYRQIDFKEYTLLIKYMLHDYTIDTYSNRYFRNTKENSYNWSVNVGTTSDTSVDGDELYFTRFAIYVKKIPEGAEVKSWFGLMQIGKRPEK